MDPRSGYPISTSTHSSELIMAQEAESLLSKGSDVLRELASHQGLAYRQYGEALVKFGSGEINASELFKTAGDLYFKEVGQIGAGLFEASTEVFSSALGTAGLRLTKESDTRKHPAAKR